MRYGDLTEVSHSFIHQDTQEAESEYEDEMILIKQTLERLLNTSNHIRCCHGTAIFGIGSSIALPCQQTGCVRCTYSWPIHCQRVVSGLGGTVHNTVSPERECTH